MKALLNANITTKALTLGTDAWTPSALSFGDEMTLALRFEETVEGSETEAPLNIDHMKAAIGNIDARPMSGTWALKVGSASSSAGVNVTADLPWNATPAQVKAAVVALSGLSSYGTLDQVFFADGSYRLKWSGASQVPLTVVNNALWPATFGRISAYQQDGEWYEEVRLTQAPVAFTDAAARVLPPPPTVTETQEGGSVGGASWNEIQTLYVPPAFRGQYILRFGTNARTDKLSPADDETTVQAALEKILGVGNVKVELVDDNTMDITFVGELASSAQTVLTVEALNPPPGDYTFTIPLDRWELAYMLKRQASVTLPLEIRIWATEGTGDDAVVVPRVSFLVTVTILAPLITPDLALVAGVNWLRPLSPTSYEAFDPSTVITGQQYFPKVVGDGSTTSFVVDHNLDTEVVFVFGRENTAGGRQLVEGTDFSVALTNNNSATVTALGSAPTTNAWLLVVMSAQTVGAFANGLTINISQVNGLQDQLDAIGDALTALQAQAAVTPLGTTSASGGPFVTINLPDFADTFPSVDGRGGLLPAVHSSSPTSVTGALPSLPSTPTAYQNNTGATITLPGFSRIRTTTVANGGYFCGDPRGFWAATRRGTTNSYFPKPFEKELWMVEISSQMLRAGTMLDVDWDVTLGLVGAEGVSRCQYVIALEHGTAPSDASPATTSPNLQDITWNSTPLFTQRVVVGPVPVLHKVGAQIIRAAGGSLSANKKIYGLTTAADAVPASADVALRCMLRDLDTQNPIAVPKGGISRQLTGGILTIA